MKKIILMVLAAIAVSPAWADTFTASWTAPTANTDGSALVLPLTYTLYEGASASVSLTLIKPSIVGLSINGTSVAAGPCFGLTATDAQGRTSVMSAIVCLPSAVVNPNPPSSVKCSFTVSASGVTTSCQ